MGETSEEGKKVEEPKKMNEEQTEINLEADLHTHTVASGHAFGTVREMALAAPKGLHMIAVTDHGPAFPGGPGLPYFHHLRGLPERIGGVEVLKGVEANIVDADGHLDLPPAFLATLDLVVAGFHEGTGFQSGSVEDNTRAMILAIRNPFVHVIAHPCNPLYPVEMEKIVLAARAAGCALEINNASLTFSRPGSGPRCEYLARLAARAGALVSIASDAHSPFSVGECGKALIVSQRAGIRPENVINGRTATVREFLRRTRQRIRQIS